MTQTEEIIVVGRKGEVARDKEAAHSLLPIQTVSSLRDPRSERLRADSIASWFRLSLDDMARLLAVTPAYVQRSPASPRLQPKLAIFECIAAALIHFVGAEAAQTWLNLPNQEIDGATPLTLIKQGHGQLVAEMLEDMLWGQPS